MRKLLIIPAIVVLLISSCSKTDDVIPSPSPKNLADSLEFDIVGTNLRASISKIHMLQYKSTDSSELGEKITDNYIEYNPKRLFSIVGSVTSIGNIKHTYTYDLENLKVRIKGVNYDGTVRDTLEQYTSIEELYAHRGFYASRINAFHKSEYNIPSLEDDGYYNDGQGTEQWFNEYGYVTRVSYSGLTNIWSYEYFD